MKIAKIHAGCIFVRWPASVAAVLADRIASIVTGRGKNTGRTAGLRTQRADPAAADPKSLVRALYDIVSGPANSAKDWARLERLHAPGAIITATQHRSTMAFAAAPQAVGASEDVI